MEEMGKEVESQKMAEEVLEADQNASLGESVNSKEKNNGDLG